MVSTAELLSHHAAESGVGGELPHMRAPTRVHMREPHGGWTVRTWQLSQ